MTARETGSGEAGGGVGAVLLALADPTRRRLLDALVDAGQASATTLAASAPVSRQAVVKHLQVLQAAGLVTGTRAGREVLYAPRAGALDASTSWLASLSAAWDTRLQLVKRAAEAAPEPARVGAVRIAPTGPPSNTVSGTGAPVPECMSTTTAGGARMGIQRAGDATEQRAGGKGAEQIDKAEQTADSKIGQ